MLRIATTAVAAASLREFVRNRMHNESPEINALLGSSDPSFQARVQMYCASSAVPTIAAAL